MKKYILVINPHRKRASDIDKPLFSKGEKGTVGTDTPLTPIKSADGDGQLEFDLYGAGMKNRTLDPITADEAGLKKLNDYFKKKLEVGGIQAVKSALRTVGNSDELGAISKVFADHFQAEGLKAEINPKELYAATELKIAQYTDILGGNKRKILNNLKNHKDNVKRLQEIRAEQKALFYVQTACAENLHNAAKDYKAIMKGEKAGNLDEAKAKLMNDVEIFGESQRLWGLYGREYSLGLLSRQLLYNNGFKGRNYRNRSFGIDDKLAEVEEARKAYFSKVAGTMDDEKFVELLLRAVSSEDMSDNLVRLQKLSIKGRLMNGFDMIREWWINALLSGPATQTVNFLGNAITATMRQVETAVGSMLHGVTTGDMGLIRASFDMQYTFQSIQESFRMAAQSFKAREGITVGKANTSYIDKANINHSITAENVGRMMGSKHAYLLTQSNVGKAIDFMGEVGRFPSTLLVTGDEYFKSMNYRIFVRTELSTIGYQRGLRGKALAKFVNDEFEGTITSTGRMFNEESLYADAIKVADEKGLKFMDRRLFIDEHVLKAKQASNAKSTLDYKERVALAERAKQASLVNTHTADIKIAGIPEITSIVSKMPLLSFVVPFIRTPANILGFGLARTPLGLPNTAAKLIAIRKRHLKKIYNAGDQREIAELNGRLATSAATTAALLYYINAQQEADPERPLITGYGPKNQVEREAWKKAGNQEYSIRVGDQYLSYQRLDPMATTLGILADLAQQSREADFEGDKAQVVMSMLLMTMQNNITNKSYVQGIDNLFQTIADTERKGAKFVGNIAGGFVPNIFNQMMNYEDKRMLTETRKTLDYLRKRTPTFLNSPLGDHTDLPFKRDPLGDVLKMEPKGFFGESGGIGAVFNPIYSRTESTDLVDNELAALGGFSNPDYMIGNRNIDLRDMYNDDGKQAYDRFQELQGTLKLNGLTLREALKRKITSAEYQQLPAEIIEEESNIELDSPRKQELRSLITAYRRVAKNEMFREFPNVYARLMQIQQAKEGM